MRVLFIVEHGNAPSIRLRLSDCFDRYRQAGVEPTLIAIRSNVADRWQAIREARRHDIVVLHRVTGLTPLQLMLLHRANRRIVFDFDDALMFRDAKHGGPLRARTLDKFLRTIDRCIAVVAGNEFLASFARGGKRQVLVLPTPIDVATYQPKEQRSGRAAIVGWLGLSDGFGYIEQIAPALRRLCETFPDLRLRVVSDKPLELTGVRVENELWSLEREQANLAAFDIGIMPLADTPWTRGKCSYKILQYMGAGTAVVASPVGMNAEVIADGVNGYLAQKHEDWVRCVGRLLDDGDERKTFALRGRALVEQKYSIERYTDAYVTLFRGICGAE